MKFKILFFCPNLAEADIRERMRAARLRMQAKYNEDKRKADLAQQQVNSINHKEICDNN